jgi:hypothetical protein
MEFQHKLKIYLLNLGTLCLISQDSSVKTYLDTMSSIQSIWLNRFLCHDFCKTSDLCVAPVTRKMWGSEWRCDVTRRVQPCWLVTSVSCRSIQLASRCDGTITRSAFNLSYSRSSNNRIVLRSIPSQSTVPKCHFSYTSNSRKVCQYSHFWFIAFLFSI